MADTKNKAPNLLKPHFGSFFALLMIDSAIFSSKNIFFAVPRILRDGSQLAVLRIIKALEICFQGFVFAHK